MDFTLEEINDLTGIFSEEIKRKWFKYEILRASTWTSYLRLVSTWCCCTLIMSDQIKNILELLNHHIPLHILACLRLMFSIQNLTRFVMPFLRLQNIVDQC